MVPEAGIEPAHLFRVADFLTTIVFTTNPRIVCGLDYTFIIAQRLRCSPSSLYTFPLLGLARY